MKEYRPNESKEILKAIKAHGYSRIALSNDNGAVTTWNPARVPAEEFFQNKIIPYLESDSTSGGTFFIVGKHAGQHTKTGFRICQINKPGPVTPEIQVATKLDQPERTPHKLIEDKAKWEQRCVYLEKENEDLRQVNNDLQSDLDEAEAEIEELTKQLQALQTENKTLSENPVNMLLRESAPSLMAAAIPAVLKIAARYFPELAEQPAPPVPGVSFAPPNGFDQPISVSPQ